MKTTTLFLILIFVLVGIGGVVVILNLAGRPGVPPTTLPPTKAPLQKPLPTEPWPTSKPATTSPTIGPTKKVTIIDIKNGAFVPKTVTVEVGDTLIFENRDSTPHWIASSPHPIHTDLPGLNSQKGLTQGERYTFIVPKAGTFGYHDHLNPSTTGTIIVK